MNEKRLQYAVAGVAVCAILGLGFLSSRPQRVRGKLKVLAQWSNTERGPAEGNPPGIYLQVESPRAADNFDSVNLKVVDDGGKVVPVLRVGGGRFNHVVPLGYSQTPIHPRLVATLRIYEPSSNGTRRVTEPKEIDSVPLAPFPDPARVKMELSSIAPFRLERSKNRVSVVPLRPLESGEMWVVSALGTDYASRIPAGNFTSTVIGGDGGGGLPLPYPVETGSVRTELTVQHQQTTTDILTVPGVRLVNKRGETAFDLPKPLNLITKGGLKVVVTAPPFPRRVSTKDHRAPVLLLDVRDDPAKNLRPVRVQIDVLSPAAESLGLNSFTIGTGRSTSPRPCTGQINEMPFDAVVRLTVRTVRFEPVQTYTVKVQDR